MDQPELLVASFSLNPSLIYTLQTGRLCKLQLALIFKTINGVGVQPCTRLVLSEPKLSLPEQLQLRLGSQTRHDNNT